MSNKSDPAPRNIGRDVTSQVAGARVMVTGASGFIGRPLVKKLASSSALPVLLVEPGAVDLSDYEQHRGDLLAPGTLSMPASGARVVYHLAAFTDPDASSPDSVRRCFDINVEGTRNLLESLGPSTEHFIFFSSVHVYGCDEGTGLDESSPVRPTSAYARSKLAAEDLVMEWGREHGLMTTVLRLPMTYGPGNKGNIFRMIDAIARRRFVMIGRGDNRRSMVYVDNVTDAAIAVALRKEADGQTFILTDPRDYTMLEVYTAIAHALGVRPMPFHVPAPVAGLAGKAFDMGEKLLGRDLPYSSQVLGRLTASLTFSSAGIEEAVGFRPSIGLEEGMAETARWFRERR